MTRIEEILDPKSKYTDENDVLLNELGLKDQDELTQAERMITSYKLSKLYLNPGKQTFDVNHYLSIHKYLFSGVYSFAGQIRDEVIEKSYTFCLPQYIYQYLKYTLEEANKSAKRVTNRDELLQFYFHYFVELDAIHPFREGNGRTEREYLRQLVEHICKMNHLDNYYFDFNLIESKEEYSKACVMAVTAPDNELGLEMKKPLVNMFDRILVVREKELELDKSSQK